jgi:hypothetical protein
MQHGRKQRVIRLGLNRGRAAGLEQRAEEIEEARPVIRQNVELENRGGAFPRPANSDGAVTGQGTMSSTGAALAESSIQTGTSFR